MTTYNFCKISEQLLIGREIEFTYNNQSYSITNYNNYWFLYCDTTKTELMKICKFDDKKTLINKIAEYKIDNKITIKEIFDSMLYDKNNLYIL